MPFWFLFHPPNLRRLSPGQRGADGPAAGPSPKSQAVAQMRATCTQQVAKMNNNIVRGSKSSGPLHARPGPGLCLGARSCHSFSQRRKQAQRTLSRCTVFMSSRVRISPVGPTDADAHTSPNITTLSYPEKDAEAFKDAMLSQRESIRVDMARRTNYLSGQCSVPFPALLGPILNPHSNLIWNINDFFFYSETLT